MFFCRIFSCFYSLLYSSYVLSCYFFFYCLLPPQECFSCFNFSFHGFTQCRNIKYILMRNLIYWGFPSHFLVVSVFFFREFVWYKFRSSAVRIYWRFISFFSFFFVMQNLFWDFFFLFFVIMTLIKSMCSFWDTEKKYNNFEYFE